MKTMTTVDGSWVGLVVRFSLVGVNATIHAAECSSAQKSRGGFIGRRFTVAPADQETVDDLIERGYPTKFCKCCKARQAPRKAA